MKTQNAETKKTKCFIIALAACFLCGTTQTAFAEGDVISIADVKQGLDTVSRH